VVTADFELPLINAPFIPNTETTRIGVAIGAEGTLTGPIDQPFEVSGELRLGVARRRYQPTWSSPILNYPICRRGRTDLAIDLGRIRIGSWNDRSSPDASGVRSLIYSFPLAALRWTYSTWAVAL